MKLQFALGAILVCACTSSSTNSGRSDGGANDAGTAADAGTETDAGGGGADAGVSALMSFFVTSVGTGLDGGSLGGLAGADAKCAALIGAAAVPASVKAKTWSAYLSTTTVAARSRIGTGPWHNINGALVAQDLTALHANGISFELMLTENGATVPANDHDILTGSDADGGLSEPVATCNDWISNDPGTYTQVGHSDWNSPSTIGNPSWNASHLTTCDRDGLLSTAGSGRTYCFAQ